MRICLVLVIGLTLGLFVEAQTSGATQGVVATTSEMSRNLPEFEVATIKPTAPGGAYASGVKVYPGGRVVGSALSLRALITVAFRVSYWQVVGGDSWTDNEKYDIEARPSDNSRAEIKTLRYLWYSIEDEHLRQMLQTLLIDRFQLKFHRDIKTGTMYLLGTSGNTLRLTPTPPLSAGADPSTADARSTSIGFAGRWVLSNTSMSQLAKFAADYYILAPVLDRTGLSGGYDYKQPEDPTAAKIDPTDSFYNLINEVGLKLERTTGPIETFVIDQARPRPLN